MKRIFLLVATVAAAVCGLSAQQMPLIPNDTLTRVGKLDNGLTYYIRHNEKPEHVADFYIAQRVGSLQEDEDQRGLAHFLEHMAFNGSTHFQGNGIIEFTRGLGVAFGRDLNATTSLDQTVYNICNVPTARQSALDSCLLVLQDWSCGLALQPEEIDKERGVVHGEWAMRSSAAQRLTERNLEKLFPGSKYGTRLPIGLMSVVDSFTPPTLRAYYEKWYHPAHQAIIVIGDVDVNHTEQTIREMFGGIKAHDGAAMAEPVAVPDNEETIYVSDHDKEMPYTVFEVDMKTDPMPREMLKTQATYVQQYITTMMGTMFNMRMTEIMQEPDCPFLQLNMGYGSYLGMAVTKDATKVVCVPKEGREEEALAALVKEVRRVKEHGFTAGEYARAKEEFLAGKEKAYSNRDKRRNDEFYRQCLSNYLYGYSMPDAETNYRMWQTMAQMLPLEVINQTMAQVLTIDSDRNLVVVCFEQEKEGKKVTTAGDMKRVIDAARTEPLTAWVDNAKDEPLIKQLPNPGKIVAEKENKQFGYTELTLSNGAKVCLKKTDFKDDEVILRGWKKGGSWLYGEDDFSNLKLYHDITETFGLAGFSNSELMKALAGKKCGVGINLGNRYDLVTGNSVPKDMETMMQLLYLMFTAPEKDEKAYNTLMGIVETVLKNRDLQPETALSDSVAYYSTKGNARFASLKVDDLKNVSLDRVMQITRERFSTADGYVFTIIGNYDEQTIRQLVCQYIGGIAKANAKVDASKDERTMFDGNVVCDFKRKMETPKPYIIETYRGETEHTLKNRILASYAGQVLSMKLLKVVREDAGASYSVGASTYIDAEPEGSYAMMTISSPISKVEMTDEALALIRKCVDEVAAEADATDVDKVRKNMLKQADINARINGTWQGIIEAWYMYGLDTSTDYKKIVGEVTPQEVSAFLRNDILGKGNRLTVVMRPE